MLKRKTRVLVTHAVDFLHLADRIVIMNSGKIEAQGTMQELADNPHLVQVMETHRRNQAKAADSSDESLIVTDPSLL